MLKLGSIILGLWNVLYAIAALAFLVIMMVQGKNTPVLTIRFSEQEIAAMSPALLDTINSISIYANGLTVALCTLALLVIWKGLSRRNHWAFWALVLSMSAAFLAGLAGDYVSGANYYDASIVSAVILASGFAATAIGIFKSDVK